MVGLLLGELVRGEFVGWPEPDSFGGNRNLEESGGIRWKYRNSCPAGIPAKKSCKSGWKQEFLRPLQNRVPVNNLRRKKMEKNHQESCVFLFFSPKQNPVKQELPT
jgi:hypothetical protein